MNHRKSPAILGFVALVAGFGAAACGSSSGPTASEQAATPATDAGSANPPASGGGTPSSSSGGAGGGGGGSGGGGDAGAPIVAPDETWTWIDVPGSACANGSPTGFAVNLTQKSDDVVLFLAGGGACWDGASCWGTSGSAFYVNGYGKAELAGDPQVTAMYVLNRADADNPFADKNLVYVPYCTGDAFAGNNVEILSYLGTDHATHFVGYENVGLFLARVTATLTRAKRVWLMGDSAGGFGAAFNFGRVAAAFPDARVDVLDDSGQPIAADPAQWAKWKDAWNMQLPWDCAACADGAGAFVDYYRAKFPSSRFGLVSFDYDTVIAPFMNISLDTFHSELYTMADHVDATWPGARYFILNGASHVGLAQPTAALKDWVKKMASDSPQWTSTRP